MADHIADQSATERLSSELGAYRACEVVVIEGPDRGLRVPVLRGGVRIGTGASCQVKLRDGAVSRIHCELMPRHGSVRLVDAGSTNGTWVGGALIRDAELPTGATFRVGASTLRIHTADELIDSPISARQQLGELVGASLEMRRIYALIERIAPTETTALVQGDTGTGKELVARALHDLSKRSAGPFIAVDCGAIAPNVIESELFGHVRGAFSGAISDRRGLFEESEGGTVFLDEIGELPLNLQAKLLRALDAREVRRVGSNKVSKIDVRVIAATNRPLVHAVNDGTFREDLYYRLAVVEIRLPPLHARREDIPLIAQHFYARFTESDRAMPKELLSSLMTRSWPGNVRELKNFVERCVALGIDERRLREPTPERGILAGLEAFVPTRLPLKEARDAWLLQFETAYLKAQLERTGGHVTRAAEASGVSRRFLQRMMARLGVRSDSDEPIEGDDDATEEEET